MPGLNHNTPTNKSGFNIIRLVGVPLDSKTLKDSPDGEAVWVQVSKAGDYKGYGNSPFSLTTETFKQMVTNFRNNPSYKAGADGIGMSDVVPWDFEHLSDPINYDANTVIQGTPAQGWIQELDVRLGQDGRAELWALTRWLDTARTYIKAEQYKWASIDFAFDCVDPITGKNVGAVLFSVALTNEPFIKGMQALAAKTPKGTAIAASYWGDAAENADEALKHTKEILGIATIEDIAVVAAEISKLRLWITTGGTPLGVDLQSIFSDLRRIYNLPALSTELEVLAETEKLVQRLLEEQAIQSGQPGPAGPISNAIGAEGEEEMPELLKALAAQFGVRETEAEVLAAAEDSASLRVGLKNALGADKDATRVLLDSARGLVTERQNTNERLTALTKALGAKDGEDPTVRITNLLKAEQELTEIKPKYDALTAQAEKHEAEQMEADVDRAIRLHALPVNVKDALILLRKSDPKKFADTYPLPPEGQEALMVSLTTQTKPATPTTPNPTNVIDLSIYAGRNDAEKMASHILATNPSAQKWPLERLYQEVHNLRRSQAGR